MQCPALRNKQHPVQLGVPVAVHLHHEHRIGIQPGQLHLMRPAQHLRRIARTKQPHAALQVTMQLHVPNGYKTIEPCVGHLVHHRIEALPDDATLQDASLLSLFPREGAWTNVHYSLSCTHGLNAARLQPQLRCTQYYRRTKRMPRFPSVVVDGSEVQGESSRLMDTRQLYAIVRLGRVAFVIAGSVWHARLVTTPTSVGLFRLLVSSHGIMRLTSPISRACGVVFREPEFLDVRRWCHISCSEATGSVASRA